MLGDRKERAILVEMQVSELRFTNPGRVHQNTLEHCL